MISVIEPGAVVGGEEDEGVFLQFEATEGVHNLPDRPVDFHHDVSEEADSAFAFKFVGNVEWDVDHAVGEVDEEGAIFVFFDELDGSFGVLGGELLLVFPGDLGVDDFVFVDEGEVRPAFDSFFHGEVEDSGVVGPHVVGVGETEVVVEAVLHGEELFMVAEVPFAIAGGRVALLFADFGDGDFVRVDADVGLGAEGSHDADSYVVTTGQ